MGMSSARGVMGSGWIQWQVTEMPWLLPPQAQSPSSPSMLW